MNILRSRYRGVIHFYPADADSPPEIEFSDGEGPEQVMNLIQDVAVPAIRKSIEPMGPYLRWEELDLEAGVVRRHRSRFHDRFEFELCSDELGIELILPDSLESSAVVGSPNERSIGEQSIGKRSTSQRNTAAESTDTRPWVPLRPLAEPGEDQLATIGWSVQAPELWWRYLQTRYAPPTIEITWSCVSLPGPWAARILANAKLLDCRLGDDQRCPMNPTRDGLLVYRGFHPFPEGAGRPAYLSVLLEQPLLIVGPENVTGEGDPSTPPQHLLDAKLPATVEAFDARALIEGRPTRLVAWADLDRPFAAEVLTTEDVLLPDLIPAGTIPGLPWPAAVEPAGFEHHTQHDREERGDAPDDASTRRWLLTPRPRDPSRGQWRDVTWQDDPPSLGFGLGAFEATKAPRITHIENRRASVAWRVEASDEGHQLCLCVPHWVPVGCPGQVALPPRDNGFDYAAEVRASLDGLEERFVIDQSSEMSSNRLFLGPRRWRYRDEVNGTIDDGEALGEGAGCVRWRRADSTDEAGRPELGPTDWAGGSAPVLLRRTAHDQAHSPAHGAAEWGGLYAPRAVPWDALEEVSAEPTPDPEEILLVPRSPMPAGTAAIWIDLWGFVCRYDVHKTVFTRGHGATSQPTAWIAATGLELFPRRSGYLLRSFSPLYAVRDPEPRIFSLRWTTPRPTLHIGRELDPGIGRAKSAPGDSRAESALGNVALVLEIGAETFVRCHLAEAGEVPTTFEPGRVPGTRLRLDCIGRKVLWLAVEQRHGSQGRQAGYLLSWDAAAGWLFRGFFAHPGTAAELGVVRRGDHQSHVFLGGEGTSRVSTFRLTIDRQGPRWSETAPEAATLQTTRSMIGAWETEYFAPERRPSPLAGHGMRILQQSDGDRPWIFEFFDVDSRTEADQPAGIRVWELHGEAVEDFAEEARELGDDRLEEAEIQLPKGPVKRILRADDGDDDF